MLPLSSQKNLSFVPPPFSVIFIAFAFCPHLSRSISKVGLMLCLMFTYLLAVAINMEIKGFFQQARDDAHFCLFPPTHTIWQNINILSKLDLYLLAHLWKDLNLKKLKKLHANWKVWIVFSRDGKYHYFQKQQSIVFESQDLEDINHGQIDFWIFIS